MLSSGRLPHGSPGVCCYDDLCTSSRDFIRKIHPHIEGGRREPIAADIAVGDFHLTGRLITVYPEALVSYRFAKVKGRDRLRAWISHLVLNLLREHEAVRQTILICEDRTFRYSPMEDSEAYLLMLLNIYWKGLRKPLHFFPESSLAYAEQAAKGTDPEKAMRTAQGKWNAYQYPEKEDSYYNLCFGQIDPLDAEFRELARAVFEPMLRYEEPVK
jgi:exodeoxyribonuclease V gamma subunit